MLVTECAEATTPHRTCLCATSSVPSFASQISVTERWDGKNPQEMQEGIYVLNFFSWKTRTRLLYHLKKFLLQTTDVVLRDTLSVICNTTPKSLHAQLHSASR